MVGFVGSGADGQERHLWCKKVILLKHGDRTHGQEELPWDWEEWLIIF